MGEGGLIGFAALVHGQETMMFHTVGILRRSARDHLERRIFAFARLTGIASLCAAVVAALVAANVGSAHLTEGIPYVEAGRS